MNSLENEVSYVSLLGKIKMDTNKTPCKCKLVLVEFKIHFSLFLNFDILSNVHYAEIEGTKCLAHSNLKVPFMVSRFAQLSLFSSTIQD